jgi:hypothetical protein
MTYELWDSSTGNCIGAYSSESAALDSVVKLAHRYGPGAREVVSLGLIVEDDEAENGSLVAQGDDLVHRAKASATQPA